MRFETPELAAQPESIEDLLTSGNGEPMFVRLQELVEARKAYRTCFANLEAFINKYWWGAEQNRALAADYHGQVYNMINAAHEIFSAAATQEMIPLDRKRMMVRGAGLVRVVLTLHQNEGLLVDLEELLRTTMEGLTREPTVNVQ
ncbi:hypothetical protein FHETE_3828 [Fusarium heterosporum]|uniref:Uncharacterized protein n=1 Tax=Fusarium heterosporum TaxID=42747 RepID=A0A8H5TMX0_FUSHE|nr:hypothetical protein FHETE_3828 [Fusarium heterosporum]